MSDPYRNPFSFGRPEQPEDMDSLVEKLRRKIAREDTRNRKRLSNPPRRKAEPATGPGPRKADANEPLAPLCQQIDNGRMCLRPTLARSPQTRLPSCDTHYRREYRWAKKAQEKEAS